MRALALVLTLLAGCQSGGDAGEALRGLGYGLQGAAAWSPPVQRPVVTVCHGGPVLHCVTH